MSATCDSPYHLLPGSEIKLTELHGPPPKPESGQNHLAQTECRSEAREEADGQNTEEVEEQAHQDRIHETQVEQRLAKYSNGKGTDDHVCRQPLGSGQWEARGAGFKKLQNTPCCRY